MDWNTFLASIAGSTIIIAVIAYMSKIFFSNMIKSSLKKAESKYKETVREEIRRDAFIYDEQYVEVKKSTEILYRTRNVCRSIIEFCEEGSETQTKRAIKELKGQFKEIEEFCFSARAILPETIFIEIHGQKNVLLEYINLAESFKRAEQKVVDEAQAKKMRELFAEVDASFIRVLEISKKHLGIT
jgi:hypothetical protein